MAEIVEEEKKQHVYEIEGVDAEETYQKVEALFNVYQELLNSDKGLLNQDEELFGLRQIIEMLLDKQEEILLKYCPFGIGHARNAMDEISKKELTGNEAIKDMREYIHSLDIIIDNEKEAFEQKDIVEAKKLRFDCLKTIDDLRQKRDEEDRYSWGKVQ